MQVSLIGTISVDKLLLPQISKQDEAVNIYSELVNINLTAYLTYSATKASIQSLRDQLRFAHKDNVHIMKLVLPF